LSLWDLFLDLHVSRPYSGMGAPAGISYTEIAAYASVRGRRLERVHVDAIRALDRAFLTKGEVDG
jgi:hypothetical protein